MINREDLTQLKEFKALVDRHDWYYQFSDDHRAYPAGSNYASLINSRQGSLPESVKAKGKRYYERKLKQHQPKW